MSALAEHTKRNSFNTTTSSSSSSIDYKLNPSKWLRKRHRSSSSASSTFSVVFESNYPSNIHPQLLNHALESEQDGSLSSLNSLSSEMEELYNNAKEEVVDLIIQNKMMHNTDCKRYRLILQLNPKDQYTTKETLQHPKLRLKTAKPNTLTLLDG
jgi:hypothetical protein